MALPQIPLNGGRAGDNRRSTMGPHPPVPIVVDQTGVHKRVPKVTIGNFARGHYGQATEKWNGAAYPLRLVLSIPGYAPICTFCYDVGVWKEVTKHLTVVAGGSS